MEFLRSVAKAFVPVLREEKLINEYSFIFPNRRSLKFFQKYLGEEYYAAYGKPLISPELITVNDFVIGLCGLKLVDSTKLLYLLYKNYISLKQDSGVDISNESFDDFVYWGDMILKDFDDIDKYLVDARQLFSNIKDLSDLNDDYSYLSDAQRKAIENFWGNFSIEPYTDKKEIFFSLWGIMYNLYSNLKSELIAGGEGYEGQIYRVVADSIVDIDIQGTKVFVGLNAPNKCERKIMTYLKNCKKGDFYWDFYGPLLTAEDNSAGKIIRSIISEYPSALTLENVDSDCGVPDNISVIGVSSGVGQAFKIAEILNGLPNGKDPIKTCVQLPDEKLLMPILNSVPERYEKINVTMGYPLSQTSFYSFMNLVSELQRGVRVYGGNRCFYYKNIYDILDHSFISGESEGSQIKREADKIKMSMLSGNMVFVPISSNLFDCFENKLLKLIFRAPVTHNEVAAYQIDILKELEIIEDSLTKEFIFQYYQRIKALTELNIEMEVKTYFKLLSRLTSSITVPFRGEPLRGLQLMGSLETRAIDFENLIIASANEGVFPSSNVNNSLIPYNLRFGFDLPTYELQDSISAYHFYRSISRVKNLYILYDTRREGVVSGEVTRYVKQLKYHFNCKLNEQIVSYKVEKNNVAKVETIVKDDQVMELLKNKNSYSISAINNYFICPMKFYLADILRIREEDEISEELESSTFGSIYHKAMELLYNPFKNKIVNNDCLEGIIGNKDLIKNVIEEAFKSVSNIDVITGRREIEFALIENYIIHTLKLDCKRAPFKYLEPEAKLMRSLNIHVEGNSSLSDIKVNFLGIVDRQEQKENKLYIIDYKTGKVDAKDINQTDMDMLFDVSTENKYHIARQLYMYAFLSGIDERNEDAILMIYGLRSIVNSAPCEILVEPDGVKKFADKLKVLMEEIFNPNIPFVNKPGCKGCEFCDFSSLCNK